MHEIVRTNLYSYTHKKTFDQIICTRRV